jgi:hypothetical protein
LQRDKKKTRSRKWPLVLYGSPNRWKLQLFLLPFNNRKHPDRNWKIFFES